MNKVNQNKKDVKFQRPRAQAEESFKRLDSIMSMIALVVYVIPPLPPQTLGSYNRVLQRDSQDTLSVHSLVE